MSKKSNLIFVLLSLWKVKLLEREKNKKIQLKLKKSFCMNYLKQGRTVEMRDSLGLSKQYGEQVKRSMQINFLNSLTKKPKNSLF